MTARSISHALINHDSDQTLQGVLHTPSADYLLSTVVRPALLRYMCPYRVFTIEHGIRIALVVRGRVKIG